MKKIILFFTFIISIVSFSEKAPNFSLKDQYGIIHTLNNYKDKTILLIFWGSYCNPCRRELPNIEKLYKEYGKNEKDIVILGMNREEENKVKQFLEDNNYTFPTTISKDKRAITNYSVEAVPTFVLINSNKEIVNRYTGLLQEEEIVEMLNNI